MQSEMARMRQKKAVWDRAMAELNAALKKQDWNTAKSATSRERDAFTEYEEAASALEKAMTVERAVEALGDVK